MTPDSSPAPDKTDGGNVVYFDPADRALPGRPWSREEQQALDRINQKIAAAETLDAAMDFVFDETAALFPCDRIGLALLEEDGRRSVSRWGRARYEPILLKPGYAEDTAGSSLLPMIEADRVRIIHDLEHYLRDHPHSASTRLVVREGVRTSMTGPLRVESRAVGWLFRSCRRPGVYGPHEARLHHAMAERLSQTVEKAWRIQQLAEANRSYSEMLGFVSHELKSPLAAMIMGADALAGGYLGALTDVQRDHVLKLRRQARMLLDLAGRYLDLVRAEEGRLTPKIQPGVALGPMVIDPVLLLLEPARAEKHMRLVRDEPGGLTADVDPDLLRIVLTNLAGNAVKYGRDGGEIRITTRRSAGLLSIAVRNEGVGFLPGERGLLFRKFSRLPSSGATARGSGVGLYSVWRILQQYGGRIEAHSEPGQWAEFRVEIPA